MHLLYTTNIKKYCIPSWGCGMLRISDIGYGEVLLDNEWVLFGDIPRERAAEVLFYLENKNLIFGSWGKPIPLTVVEKKMGFKKSELFKILKEKMILDPLNVVKETYNHLFAAIPSVFKVGPVSKQYLKPCANHAGVLYIALLTEKTIPNGWARIYRLT
jgi:hypothetical protein